MRLLGGLALGRGREALPAIESARAESLLAYLVLHRHAPQSRQHLAFLLWPDSTEAQARTNLRHVLHTLRRALPDSERFIDVQARTLQWRPDAPVTLDVADFEATLERADRAPAHRRGALLRAAVRHYAGDLLPGHFDDWVLDERARLRGRYVGALERVAHELEATGRPAEALDYAEQLVRHEPLQEEAHRLLVRLHHACGNRPRALHAYHACVATLERELGIGPSAATRTLYQTLLATEMSERWDLAAPAGPPLVGRVTDLRQLEQMWRAAERGRPHLALLTGEPGIGKTRLAEELRHRCVRSGAVTAAAYCYRPEGALAYGPVVAWLRAEGLRQPLARLDRTRLSELARLLPDLLAVDGVARPEPLPEPEQRQRLYDALASGLRAAGAPLLLLLDDLQWCDRETLSALHFLLRADAAMPVLVVATARREDAPDGGELDAVLLGLQRLDRCTEIPLGRLTEDETATLATRVAGGAPAQPSRLFAETEGNPLFVIEALRAGWDGRESRPWVTPRLRAAIAARLGDLSPPARELAGLAATIGRAFTADVLAAASPLGEVELVAALDELWRRRIVREQGRDLYDFTHDKIRETAYEALSPAVRRWHHLQVARALQRAGTDRGGDAALVAAHYEAGGDADDAVAWYRRAAEAAQLLHANTEALRLLERAVALLGTLLDTPARRERELAVLTALPAALVPVEGYTSARVREVQERALGLAAGLGVELGAPLLRSLAITALDRYDFEAARTHAGRLRVRGQRTGDRVVVVEAEYVLGAAAFWHERFAQARTHWTAAAEGFRPQDRRVHVLRYGHDTRALSLTRLAHTLWFLGCAGRAAEVRDAAFQAVAAADHPYSRSAVLVFSAMLALETGDVSGLRTCVAQLAAIRGHARHNRVLTEVLCGYVDILDGDRTAVGRLGRAVAEPPADGPGAPGVWALCARLLVAGCLAAEDVARGRAAVDGLLAASVGAGVWRSEAHRVRAWLLAAEGGDPREVEADLCRALAVARKQRAPGPELRAAVDLLRHRRTLDPGSESTRAARDGLERAVARLPERARTADLDAATALLLAH